MADAQSTQARLKYQYLLQLLPILRKATARLLVQEADYVR